MWPQDVVSLVEGIRNNMPLSLGTITTRLRLEEVFNALTGVWPQWQAE
jgi:hypothetical protein